MGVRQSLNNNPAVTTGMTIVIIVGAFLVVYRSSCSVPKSDRGDGTTGKQYFTVDDGKTYFADDANKVPPFDHHGQPAYGVKVYRCPDGKEFVSHLERYAEADRKRMQEAIDHAIASKSALSPGPGLAPEALEVKRPGETEWVKWTQKTAERWRDIQTPQCEGGATMPIEQVLPR